jgi:hypothetical protein
MKNVLKAFGVIAIAAVIGFSMAACDDDNGPSRDPGGTSGGVLPAPSNIRCNVSGTSVYITWNAVSGASGYNLYVSGSSSFPANNTDSGRWYSTTYTENNIPSGTYYFKIAAFNANGIEGAMSSVYSFTIGGATTPTTPNTSIEGTWVHNEHGREITVIGSTGYISAFGTHPIVHSAAEKGYVKLGDPEWRNLKNTGGLEWSGERLGFYYSSPDVCTGVVWVDVTFTMGANGQTLTFGSNTYTRQ